MEDLFYRKDLFELVDLGSDKPVRICEDNWKSYIERLQEILGKG